MSSHGTFKGETQTPVGNAFQILWARAEKALLPHAKWSEGQVDKSRRKI